MDIINKTLAFNPRESASSPPQQTAHDQANDGKATAKTATLDINTRQRLIS
jgi:hypothetical protein